MLSLFLGVHEIISRNSVAEAGKQTAPGVRAAPGEPMLDYLKQSIRNRLLRSRELLSQGKSAEAGKKLDAIGLEARKKPCPSNTDVFETVR